jgi:hypothetical protein
VEFAQVDVKVKLAEELFDGFTGLPVIVVIGGLTVMVNGTSDAEPISLTALIRMLL